MWIWISISMEYEFLLSFLAFPFDKVVVLLTDFAFPIFTTQAVWQFTYSVFQFIWLWASSAAYALYFFTPINYAERALEAERRVTIRADTFLVSNATFLNLLTDWVTGDIESTITWITAKIIVVFAMINNAATFHFLERRIALDTIVVFLNFTAQYAVHQTVILSQTVIGATSFTNLQTWVSVSKTILNSLSTSSTLQYEIYLIIISTWGAVNAFPIFLLLKTSQYGHFSANSINKCQSSIASTAALDPHLNTTRFIRRRIERAEPCVLEVIVWITSELL